jgi:hypothetical protein
MSLFAFKRVNKKGVKEMHVRMQFGTAFTGIKERWQMHFVSLCVIIRNKSIVVLWIKNHEKRKNQK